MMVVFLFQFNTDENFRKTEANFAELNASATFLDPGIWTNLRIPVATASLTRWYAMALCFFFSVDDGMVVLVTTIDYCQAIR